VFDYMLLNKLPTASEVAALNGGTRPERSPALAALMGPLEAVPTPAAPKNVKALKQAPAAQSPTKLAQGNH
jgi:hypothetical protein